MEKNVGYKDLIYIPIDAFNNINITSRVDKAVCPWYNGPSLFEAFDELPIPKRNPEAAIRIPIIDKMKD